MIAIGGSPALAAAFAAPGMVPRVQSSARSMVRMEDDADADWTGAAKWSDSFKEPEAVFDILKIKEVLPHRYPFLMVDRVTRIDGNQITAEKNVTINEPYFQGHFPGHPIMPGVLQLEAMAQVAGILTLKQADNAGKIAYFMAADKVKWRKPVKPGDVLQIDIELLRARGKVAKAKGVCTVRGEVVSEAEITFTLAGNS